MRKSKKTPLMIIGGLFFSIVLIGIAIFAFNRFFPEYAISFDLIGKVPLCNRNIERAIHIHGFVFPFCIRCTSIIFSYLSMIGILFLPKVNERFVKSNQLIWYLLSGLLIIPLIVDGFKVYFFQIDSPNYIRVYTGILFGIGAAIGTKGLTIKLFT